jgi:quercetin dioxygenase-like cupin family protein
VGFIDVGDLEPKVTLPGWVGRFFHSEHMTFAYWDIEEGATLHEHEHPNEEVWHVVEGEIVLTVGGVEHTVRAGQAMVIAPADAHSVVAHHRCRVIVADYPLRDSLAGVSIR